MLTPSERAESDRRALVKCADFEEVVTELVYGFDGSDPRHLMTRDGIIEFVRNRYGELFVTFCHRLPQFIVH
jgi:hypothetical protein